MLYSCTHMATVGVKGLKCNSRGETVSQYQTQQGRALVQYMIHASAQGRHVVKVTNQTRQQTLHSGIITKMYGKICLST